MNNTTSKMCPCCSNKRFEECCKPILNKIKPANSAEQLMRSRYTAYTLADVDYLLESTHPETRHEHQRENILAWATNATWLQLTIVPTPQLKLSPGDSSVEFIATYQEHNVKKTHHEKSLFKQLNGLWYFHSGVVVDSNAKLTMTPATTVSRNAPCPCGSGKKYKRCCGNTNN